MRTVVCTLSLLVVSAFGVRSQDNDKETKKGEGIKCESEYLEKTWGIKCKSVTDRSDTLQLLMEFTKDVDDLKAMREALTPPRVTKKKEKEPTFHFHYFDSDNVQIGKEPVAGLAGELSGKKGDAFRLYVRWGIGYAKTVVKIDGRPAEKPEPDKDKDKPLPKGKDKKKKDKPSAR